MQTTSTKQALKKSPNDMASSGGKAPNNANLTTSSRCTLGSTPIPVANLNNKAKMGTVQVNSSKVGLSRTATSPYEKLSALKPQVSFKGKR